MQRPFLAALTCVTLLAVMPKAPFHMTTFTVGKLAKGAAIVRQYHIAFPIVASQPAVGKVAHRAPTPQPTPTPESTPPKLSRADQALFDYCAKHAAKQCLAYAQAHGIKLDMHVAETGPIASGGELSTLPETFIIDRHGILRFYYQGYNTARDNIRAGLRKIGIR